MISCSKLMDPVFTSHILPFAFLFLLLVPPYAMLLDERYSRCSAPTARCAGLNITYPFSLNSDDEANYCAHPGYGVDCDDDNLTLKIRNETYQVLDIIKEKQSLIVVWKMELYGYCPEPSKRFTLDHRFNLTDNDLNATLLVNYWSPPPLPPLHPSPPSPQLQLHEIKCPSSSDYLRINLTQTSEFLKPNCLNTLMIPMLKSAAQEFTDNKISISDALEQGFEMNWGTLTTECLTCMNSSGACGYNTTLDEFRCFCSDGAHQGTCHGPLQSSRESKWQIKLGIGAGCGIGSVALFVLLWQLYKIVRRKWERKLRQKFFQKNGVVLLQQQLSSLQGNFVTCKMFKLNELEKATDNFNKDHILGQGGQGTVYKGMLKDGKIVAIKKSKVMHNEVQQFINEVLILSQINHRNIVKLFGCCLDSKEHILIYEFIPNGTLYKYLHTPPYEERSISWEIRLRIATEVARGLAYLHCAASIPIYHRDIKSTNILLDGLYCAKIADFGTSRSVSLDQTHVTTRVQGTFGYLDPEYFRSSRFTDKSDVYSFGVVLVELLTRQKAVCSTRAEEGKNLATYFIETMEKNQLFEIIDPQIQIQNKDKQIVAVADLAIRCLNVYGRQRPTMKDVAMILEGLDNCSQLPLIMEEIHEDFATDSSKSYDTNPLFMTAPFQKIASSTSALGVHSISQASTW